RWYFNPRTRELDDNFVEIAEMMRVINNVSLLDTDLENIMDVEQFLRMYAARCAHDDWDTISIGNGQNAYFYYAPIEGRFKLLPWDMDHSWGNASARLYPDADGSFSRVLQRPKFRRMYLAILDEMLNGRGSQPGYWSAGEMVTKVLDRNTAAVGADGVANANAIRSFINSRRGLLLGELPAAVGFAITTNSGRDFTVDTGYADIEGNAWVDVYTIAVGDQAATPTWLSTTRWRVRVDLDVGANELDFLAFDVEGQLIGSDQITVTTTFGWEAPEITGVEPPSAMPGESVVISGDEFHDGIEVFFGETAAAGVEFDEGDDPLRLSAEVPLLPPGTVELAVENTDGRRSAPFPFTILALPPQFTRGDVNLDGLVDISDPIRLLLHLFGGLEASCRDAGDADNDEVLNVTDAIYLLDFLFRDGAAPSAPFPGYGEDPDGEEPLDCQSGIDIFAGW
ncbi:MAG: CotH kinase family protein, partial [Planctomycetes bacterium]|nr:CotH kinase family protein [Planctomycetota bacterium]